MVQFHIADTVPGKNFGMYATMSLVANVTLVAASLVVPFVTTDAEPTSAGDDPIHTEKRWRNRLSNSAALLEILNL